MTQFNKGDKVRLRNDPSRIGVILSDGLCIRDSIHYEVAFDLNAAPTIYTAKDIESVEETLGPIQLLLNKDFSSTAEFSIFLLLKKLETPLSDNLYTFYSSRTQFEPHQFKPALKFLDSVDQKLLIADEVGLGKTIEAGIILKELDARLNSLPRVLVVCPSALAPKWQGELKRRFSEEFRVLKSSDIREFLNSYADYGHEVRLRGICSQETLRRFTDDLNEERVHFDLIIVDEAHHWRNPDTKLSALGEVLSEYADAMLMLTATPLHIGSENLFNLLHIMLPQQFDNFALFQHLIHPNQYINRAVQLLHRPADALEVLRNVEITWQRPRFLANPHYQDCVGLLSKNTKLSPGETATVRKKLVNLNTLSHVFTRTKKRETGIRFPTREARVINVKYSEKEMEFYNDVTHFVEERFRAHWDVTQGISFARIMPQRQVSSCIPAMRTYLKKQIGSEKLVVQKVWEGDDMGVTVDDAWKIGTSEKKTLENLLERLEELEGEDTKFACFIDSLKNLEYDFRKLDITPKIIVFSFFKATLEHLLRKLQAAGYDKRLVMIHGDVKEKDREKRSKIFRDNPEVRIMLSSEVGSEGLDFEFCNVLFNYDLPWNPMKVEQRIGRLDRYGQKHDKILIYNFSIQNTIDATILDRLYQRINIFERYIGDLEEILGDKISVLTKDMFNPNLNVYQKKEKAESAAIAIEARIKELEEFESQSTKFLGQDDYFSEEISSIKDTRRFITPQEVWLLFDSFLKMEDPRTTLRPPKSGKSDIYVLKASDRFHNFFAQYSKGMNGREKILKELAREEGATVTFESMAASADHSLMFLTIHHPIIRCMVKRLSENAQELGLKPAAAFSIQHSASFLGNYLYFIYMLEESSLKKTLRLVPVLINLSDRNNVHIEDTLSSQFIGLVPEAKDITLSKVELSGLYDDQDVIQCRDLANAYLTMFREDEEKALVRSNLILVDTRIEQIKKSHEVKIDKINQTLMTVSDPRLIRMYRGRIRNLENQLTEQVEELENKRGTSVGFRLLACGFVRFE